MAADGGPSSGSPRPRNASLPLSEADQRALEGEMQHAHIYDHRPQSLSDEVRLAPQPAPPQVPAGIEAFDPEPGAEVFAQPLNRINDPNAPPNSPLQPQRIAVTLSEADQRAWEREMRFADIDDSLPRSLSNQIRLALQGDPSQVPAGIEAFDSEPGAEVFAQLLNRINDPNASPNSALPAQRRAVIHAIAEDQSCRAEVFAMAINALGTCGDNVAEGFSQIVQAVANHRMVKDVENGRFDNATLADWYGAQYRMGLLETAVHAFIATKTQEIRSKPSPSRADTDLLHKLETEPVETMLHAKTSLKAQLRLPESVPSTMSYQLLSVLSGEHLVVLKTKVLDQASDTEAFAQYLLQNETWCKGTEAINKQAFVNLQARHDQDPFYDLAVPDDLTSPAAFDYVEKAKEVQAGQNKNREELLMDIVRPHLAGVTDTIDREEGNAALLSRPDHSARNRPLSRYRHDFILHEPIDPTVRQDIFNSSLLTHPSVLDLPSNNLSAAFARTLARDPTRTVIHLSNNNLGDEGAQALAGHPTCTSLDLSYNGVGNSGAQALAGNTRLTFLSLAGNEVGNAGAQYLSQNVRLTVLDLSNNNIGDAGARALADNTTLRRLELPGNDIGDEGALALARNGNIRLLILEGNPRISEETRAEIQRSCEHVIF